MTWSEAKTAHERLRNAGALRVRFFNSGAPGGVGVDATFTDGDYSFATMADLLSWLADDWI